MASPARRRKIAYKFLPAASQDWRNALLWSHYGDKHNGMCLGLNIGPGAQVSKPRYVKTRKRFDPDMKSFSRLLRA